MGQVICARCSADVSETSCPCREEPPEHVSQFVDVVMTAAALGGVNESNLKRAAEVLRSKES